MNIADHKPDFQKTVDYLERELKGLRTGRASPILVEEIPVEAYCSKMPLKGISSISIPDARTIQIEPWDKNLLKEIEKAIAAAKLGLNPVVDSTVVRLVLPKLTEENRRDLLKVAQKKLEEARVAVRAVREKIRSSVIEAERTKKISEDERYRLQEELDKLTKKYIEDIDRIGTEKEKEIMTV